NEKEVTSKLNEMSLDIREVLTTLNHFNEKFNATNDEIREIKETSKENQLNLQKITLDVNTLKNDNENTKKDVEVLFDKIKERDNNTNNDRKWLVGNVISVVIMFVGLIGLIMNIIYEG